MTNKATSAMSFRHEWVLAIGKDSSLNTTARLMAVMAIMEYGKPQAGQPFWPSHKSLGELVGVSERTAERRMVEVTEAGWLIKNRRTFGGSNSYTPLIPDNIGGVGDAHVPDNLDAIPAKLGGTSPSDLAAEQIHEHLHLNIPTLAPVEGWMDQDLAEYPCFGHGTQDCSICRGLREWLRELDDQKLLSAFDGCLIAA